MSLNAAAISETGVTAGMQAVLREWLALWFDGGTHAVGTAAVAAFPHAVLAFGQSEVVQPLGPPRNGAAGDPVEIRVVALPRWEEAWPQINLLAAGKLVTEGVVLQCWVSVKKIGKGQGQYLARQTADLLKALFSNPDARFALCEKGLTGFEPLAPRAVSESGYDKYLVAVGCRVQYAVEFDMSGVRNDTYFGGTAWRFRPGKGWQQYNYDTQLWYTLINAGNPPEMDWDSGEAGPVPA